MKQKNLMPTSGRFQLAKIVLLVWTLIIVSKFFVTSTPLLNTNIYAKQKQPGALKKGTAK